MSKKILQAAAGAAGGESVYVEDVFSTYLYTGDSGTQSISNGIDLDGEGGLVWIKGRTAAYDHGLYDTARGATKEIYSNKTDSQQTNTDTVTSFNSDGFSVGADPLTNNNLEDYASWTFRKQAGFFDVVTYTGDGTTSRQISHNLGSSPGVIIVKKTSSTDDWMVFHRSEGVGKYGYFNGTDIFRTDYTIFSGVSSTDFTVGNSNAVNLNGATYVAYLFAHDDQSFGDDSDESIIKCGSYSGNGLTTGNEITLGFEPQWLMVKRTDSTGYWAMMDIMRGITDSTNNYLQADSSAAEQATGSAVTPTATGFNILTDTSPLNNSSGTYIYIAIRRPMKTPEAGTDVFAPIDDTGSKDHNLGFSPDLTVFKRTDSGGTWAWYDRFRGNNKYLGSNDTDAEATLSNIVDEWLQEGVSVGSNISAGDSYSLGNFKRATGFFDVVAYTGTGVARTVAHNLGVVPELMIVKQRSGSSESWTVWNKTIAANNSAATLWLNSTSSVNNFANRFNSTSPTASVFSVAGDVSTNGSGSTYIAYLFATLDGVSKVGSYTGTGSNVDVDCGFSAGARFVLIKRTDSTGDWYVWDSERGIVAGNDPYLLLNSTAAEVTSTDYIDPLSSGFTVTSSAPAGLNASGGSYIFLAIS